MIFLYFSTAKIQLFIDICDMLLKILIIWYKYCMSFKLTLIWWLQDIYLYDYWYTSYLHFLKILLQKVKLYKLNRCFQLIYFIEIIFKKW